MTNPENKGSADDWTAEQAQKVGNATEISARESGVLGGQIAASDETFSPEGDLEDRGAVFPRAKLKEQRPRVKSQSGSTTAANTPAARRPAR